MGERLTVTKLDLMKVAAAVARKSAAWSADMLIPWEPDQEVLSAAVEQFVLDIDNALAPLRAALASMEKADGR